MPIDTKLLGFLVSYRTNEVNEFASLVVFLLALTVLFSVPAGPRLKLVAFLVLSALSAVLFMKGLPLLFVWFCAALIKLFRLRCWSLFFLMLTAATLPFGGGIGTPIHALFGIIVAAYVTSLGWSQGEKALTIIKSRYVMGVIIASAVVLVTVRVGIKVPIVTRVANPLLMERERTYQLESVLAWLHNSEYCGYEISFVEKGGSPIEDVGSAITRRNRPPAGLSDVQLFWDTVLRCKRREISNDRAGTAIVTFGGPSLINARSVFIVGSTYAGDATVWIRDSSLLMEHTPGVVN